MSVVTVMEVKDRIWEIENFRVSICNPTTLEECKGEIEIKEFPYQRAARETWTVAQWRKRRFKKVSSSLVVRVIDLDGNEMAGNTTLGSIRDLYQDIWSVEVELLGAKLRFSKFGVR